MELGNFKLELYELRIIETLGIILFFLLMKLVVFRFFNRIKSKYDISSIRSKSLKKIISTLMYLMILIFILIIWGVDQKELTIFISSFLTILGIAFFAQWSILSNITASIILYVNHPVKIGDKIKILDKDFSIEGEIENIGLFFIYIKDSDAKTITIPTQIMIQKMVKRIGKE